MLNIKVDEGYAFDYLAILYVKNLKFNTELSKQTYLDCFFYLKNQIDENIYSSIIASEEYLNLIDANIKTFDAVDKARYGEISAKEVDNLNMLRYTYKVKLQNKFFSSSEITEKKN
jgi:hypothetical protein